MPGLLRLLIVKKWNLYIYRMLTAEGGKIVTEAPCLWNKWALTCTISIVNVHLLLWSKMYLTVEKGNLGKIIPDIGLPGWLGGKDYTCQPKRCHSNRFLGEKIPWRRIQQPTPVLLPGKSHGQRSLVGYSPWGSDMMQWLNSK